MSDILFGMNGTDHVFGFEELTFRDLFKKFSGITTLDMRLRGDCGNTYLISLNNKSGIPEYFEVFRIVKSGDIEYPQCLAGFQYTIDADDHAVCEAGVWHICQQTNPNGHNILAYTTIGDVFSLKSSIMESFNSIFRNDPETEYVEVYMQEFIRALEALIKSK